MGAFAELTAAFDGALLIVTARAGEQAGGCVVGFATQASIEPERFLVCLSKANRTLRIARAATHLGVHLLGADDVELARLFGGETADEIDKLATVSWRPGPGGVPLLDGLPARFAGRVLERVPLGDHVGHLLEPEAAASVSDLRPLRAGDASARAT